jgi:hypothetical protein
MHRGPTISKTYPFQKTPKSNQIIDRPVPNKIIKVSTQYGAYLSCILLLSSSLTITLGNYFIFSIHITP